MPDPPLTGEQIQAKGVEGARRAKRWLEATCRAEVTWENPQKLPHKLQFERADGQCFSYDLGGKFMGGDSDGEEFLAEVKFYQYPSDQGGAYRDYIAKCYRAYSLQPIRCDHFLWITWTPFLVSQWHQLVTKDFVMTQAEANAAIVGETVDGEICAEVANRLWVLVLSPKQEALMIEDDQIDEVMMLLRKRRKT